MRIRLIDRTVDLERNLVLVEGREVALTAREGELLHFLARHPMQTFTNAEILDQVWAYHPGVITRTVTTTVSRLRTKIEQDPRNPRHLRNTYGVGYRLEPEGVEASGIPNPAGPFIGRGSDLEHLAAHLDAGRRLITVVGPGGAGKTRLVIELLRARAASQRVVFCDLSGCAGRASVVHALAQSLGVDGADESRIGRTLQQLGDALLVLDNLDAAVHEIGAVLIPTISRAPELAVLMTSRERLGTPEETVHELAGMTTDDAVELFVTRATAGTPGFRADAHVVELVSLLDRLPLAIELTAGRVNLMSTQQLVERIRASPLGLAGGVARSIRAALEASWALLDARSRSVLVQCAVFAETFTIEAAVAVLNEEAPEIEAALADLRARSLLRSDLRPPRLGLYDSVRAFALEQERDPGLAGRYRDHFIPTAIARAEAAWTSEGQAHRAWLRAEAGNVTAAIDSTQGPRAVRGALALVAVPETLGSPTRRRQLLDRCRAGTESFGPDLEAALWTAIAAAQRDAGDAEAVSSITTALDLSQGASRARALCEQGQILLEFGTPEAAAVALVEARDLAAGSGDRLTEGEAMVHLGRTHTLREEPAAAAEHFRRAAAVHRASGNSWSLGVATDYLGMTFHLLDRDEEAIALHKRAARTLAEVGNVHGQAVATGHLANVFTVAGRCEEAARTYMTAAALHRQLGETAWMALMEGNLAVALLHLGKLEEAYAHCTNAVALYADVSDPHYECLHVLNLGNIEVHLGRSDAAEQTLHRGVALARELGAGMLEWVGLLRLGFCEMERGDQSAAERRIRQAVALTDPEDHQGVSAFAWLGAVLAMSGQVEEAESLLHQAEEVARVVARPSVTEFVALCSAALLRVRGASTTLPAVESLHNADSRLLLRWMRPD